MAYKSILTVITALDLGKTALEASVQMAERQDAHLDILALGVDHSQPGYYYAGANALIEQATLEKARSDAEKIEDAARQAMSGRAVRWALEAGVAQIGTIAHLVGQRARFADLVLLRKPYGEGRNVADEAVLEAALFNGAAPVLIVPEGETDIQPQNAVLAWNESAEAMGAIRSAMPLLMQAESTNIVIIDPPRHSSDRSDPGGLLSQMLSRHGVRAEISVIAGTMPRTADVLARHMQDRDADLLVMGAYGHSRFRESILGGATRDMLESAEKPIFMKH